MPDADAPIPLAEDFAPPPTREAWLALVEKSLKGAPFDSLVTHSPDGLDIQPLYTAHDAKGRRVAGAEPAADQPWEVRTLIDDPDCAQANRHALEDLENGASSLLLRLDSGGIAVSGSADLGQVLDGVVLEVAPVALDAGWSGTQAATWLGEAAKRSPTARLAFHLDPIGAFARDGWSPGPVESHVAEAARTAAPLLQSYPQATAFLASGAVVHEAGGTDAQELGFLAASLVAYVQAFVETGLEAGAALGRMTAGVTVEGDYFAGIAKLRAARLICRRIAEACGADEAADARIEARGSGRMLSRVDAWTNLLRLTAAGFAAAAGGADAIVLPPFTQPLGRPTAMARRQCRNIQLLLMQESHLGRVRDPAAGAWAVEAMTDQLARAGWAVFQAIEREGGLLSALQSGLVAANVEGARAALQAATERRGVLGVTKFPNPQERPAPTAPAPGVSSERSAYVRLPGADSACSPLKPIRLSEAYENFDGALT